MNIAIIPARGGSKRIPGKNIKEFCGKPIISYSIEAALQSNCFERVVVSTDDEAIASVARRYGAEVPFMRPVELSDDHTGTIPVIQHAIQWFVTSDVHPELVCCIYATAPFLCAEDIRHGLQVIEKEQSEYAFSVTSFTFPIQRAVRILPNGRLRMFQPENFNVRSQDLEEAYHDAGQFYWGRSDAFLREVPIFSEAAAPVLLPRWRVQDIDTPEDWRMAELMHRALQQSESV